MSLGEREPGFTHLNAAVSPPTGPLPDCAYLGASLDSPVPQFPRLSSGDGDITHAVGLSRGVDKNGRGATLAGTRRGLQNHIPAVPSHSELGLIKQTAKVPGMSMHPTHSSGQEALGGGEEIGS